ncbi:MAG: hypothetical protein KAT28_01820 [Candidatus Aenigmarchaeota archaeon]|nr:hypothetical protein [Candidatus Aenigmarchaeota archaeon]
MFKNILKRKPKSELVYDKVEKNIAKFLKKEGYSLGKYSGYYVGGKYTEFYSDTCYLSMGECLLEDAIGVVVGWNSFNDEKIENLKHNLEKLSDLNVSEEQPPRPEYSTKFVIKYTV